MTSDEYSSNDASTGSSSSDDEFNQVAAVVAAGAEVDSLYWTNSEDHSTSGEDGHSTAKCVETDSAGDGVSAFPAGSVAPQTPCAESTDSKRKRAPFQPYNAPHNAGSNATGNARKKRRKGGFTNKGRVAYRQQNGAGSLVSGNERSCLPDATWNVAPALLKLHGATYEGLKACMPGEGDTSVASVDTYLQQFGLALTPVSAEFLGVKGGAALALLQRTSGSFVVQLRVTTDNSDDEPDMHFVAFDGQCVKDNARTAKVKEIDAGDRATPAAARAVFDSLFPGLKVMVSAVYELS
jgi:hypothetical protein